MEKNQAAANEKPVTPPPETVKAGEETGNESLGEQVESGEGGTIEYTELALDCLDLKAQEDLLSPPLSGSRRISLCF